MYAAGDVKRDPDSGDVAVRTTNDDTGERANRAWLVATQTRGARFASNSDVDGWDDIYTMGS